MYVPTCWNLNSVIKKLQLSTSFSSLFLGYPSYIPYGQKGIQLLAMGATDLGGHAFVFKALSLKKNVLRNNPDNYAGKVTTQKAELSACY